MLCQNRYFLCMPPIFKNAADFICQYLIVACLLAKFNLYFGKIIMWLHKVLHQEWIKIPLKNLERDAAIHELLEIVGHEVGDMEQIYQAVLAREKVMTTGVGNAIAIPHCKSTMCSQFVIALGISTQGIDFNAVDNKTVNLIFLLLGPEDAPNIHIKLLSRISRILNREEIRHKLVNCKSGREAHQLIESAEKDFQEV